MIDLISRMNELKKAAETRKPDSPDVFPSRTIIDDLAGLYQEIIGRYDAIEAAQPENQESLLCYDETLRTLEGKFNGVWQNVTDQQKRQVVEKLTETKVLPEFVGKAIDLFGGRIISMVTER